MCFVLNNNDVGSGISISDLRRKIKKASLLDKKGKKILVTFIQHITSNQIYVPTFSENTLHATQRFLSTF